MQDSPAKGGRTYAGRYRRIGRLGTGGMASVFLAYDEALGREVAVKRLHSAAPEDLLRRFRREAQLGAALNHPNIVTIFDSITDEDSLLIVMEYVKGEGLDGRIDRGPIDPEQALAILEQTASALDYAHEQDIVHRDVKPSNLLIREDGVVKVADLGIATATDMSQITASGSVMGTLPYIAPERLRGRPAGPECDVYSLAAVAFEMLAGRRAIEPRTPEDAIKLAAAQSAPDLRDAWPGAPARAAEIICTAMAADPADRHRSATALVEELEDALGQTGSTNAELAAATVPLAIIPDPDAVPDPAEEEPTLQQEAPAVPPPPPRPVPSRPRREPTPEPPRRPAPPPSAPLQREPRRISGAAIAAIAACFLVAAAIAVAVFSSGGGDETGGEDTANPVAEQGSSGSGQGSGAEDGGEAPADTTEETSGEEAPPPEEPVEETTEEPADTEEPVEPSSTEGLELVGTAPAPDPAYGASLNDQGYGLLLSGDPEGALGYFEEAITHFSPGSADVNYHYTLYNLADALVQLERGEEAIPYLEERLRLTNFKRGIVEQTYEEALEQAGD